MIVPTQNQGGNVAPMAVYTAQPVQNDQKPVGKLFIPLFQTEFLCHPPQ